MTSDPERKRSDLATTIVQIQDFQAGDRQVVDCLLGRYVPIVREIVAVRLGRTLRAMIEVEDLVQQTMLDAFAGLASFRHESEGSFRNWLARIVENNIRDADRHSRAQKRSTREPIGFVEGTSSGSGWIDVSGSGPSPSEVAMCGEEGDRIERALLSLPERYREVLLLRHKCGMEFREIAAEFGLSEDNTARQMHHRAKEALRQAYLADRPASP